jgi:adiponectin receptor
MKAAFSSQFNKPSFRSSRALVYVHIGLCGAVFVAHGLCLNGIDIGRRRLALGWMLIVALLNLLGALANTSRVCA